MFTNRWPPQQDGAASFKRVLGSTPGFMTVHVLLDMISDLPPQVLFPRRVETLSLQDSICESIGALGEKEPKSLGILTGAEPEFCAELR